MTPFEGFTMEALDFLAGLEQDNTKAYFEAHRDVYLTSIREPLEALLEIAEPRYGQGRVMRPNRDVRFSTDISPYKTTASMWAGGVSGVYVSLGARGLQAGGGLYQPSPDQLARSRDAINNRPLVAERLRHILAELTRDGFEVAGPSLKTAPRGFGRDHPAIELLRLKHYAAVKQLPVEAAPEAILATWTAVEPLITWCAENAGAAQS